MLNLLPHHRFHIPNGLAIFAAVLLLITSVAGFKTSEELKAPGQATTISVKAENAERNPVNDAVKRTRRGLNLGLPLFSRG